MKDIELIDQAMEAYSNKYKPQLPWVTVEKNLYSMIDVNRQLKTQMKGLELSQKAYICVQPSLKTNYLY